MIRLRPFSYFAPNTLSEAIEILAEQGTEAFPLAGGTDLLVRMKTSVIKPSALINLKRIAGLNGIMEENGRGVRIGALTPLVALEQSPLIQSSHPVMVQAVGVLGSPPIRTLGTLGGNIGRASPASDMAPVLMVMQARVAMRGPKGEREVDIEEVFTGPGEIALTPGEVITSFFLPVIPPHSGAVYLKMRRREGMDCALAGVATSLTLSGGKTEAKGASIALSSVAPVPFRARKAEGIILSGPLSEKRMREAAEVASEEISPITDFRASGSYRREIVKALTFRALMDSFHQARGGGKDE
ncbi:MAG: xanthine dehydrogenase family protein subunit M [Deltaproteobacteria bacterium]|nr:xanthine dehydrogenase family protein subunit M [Deltaproteobacteria bacterium]